MCFLISVNAWSQKLTTAQEVIDKYLEVTKIKANAATIKDITISMTSESSRGVAETEMKIQFPLKASMNVYANGMTVMSMIYDGEKMQRSGFGGQSQPAVTGAKAKSEGTRLNPFLEMEYQSMGIVSTLLADETIEKTEYYVVENKDTEGKTWKDYYNKGTGFKDRSFSINESPRGKFESTSIYEKYKAFKGSDILFSSVRKQIGQMGEITSEVQSIKFNKGLKDKDFEIK